MARIHRIGKPENASESKAITRLAATLPQGYMIFHNFELCTGSGLPYEYDLCVVGDFAVWHVEVKGYRGTIQGDRYQWTFENGAVQPSPIPLANKKTKILASRIKGRAGRLRDVFVDTAVLLTDDQVRVRIQDEQASRVIRLQDAPGHFTDPDRVPVRTSSIEHLHDPICERLFGLPPSRKIRRIGLYDVIEKINQTDTRTVFLASHRFIRTRPKTILKVFHFDMYTSDEERERQIQTIFHDQNAVRLLGAHPNLIDTGDMFAWEDDQFVLPTEYIDQGRPLRVLLDAGEDREITWAEKADWIAKTARGLRHAHRRGVIHRDIRPMNVVVAPGGICKLVNFDLALIEGGASLGEPKGLVRRLDQAYVAPEVWCDPGAATTASDIYSLGILFYELITSQRPYGSIADLPEGAETPLDRELLLAELGTPGSEDFMDAPADAADVIARMCRQDPWQRYQDMDEVLEDLAILAE
ncbi:MAG: protein kinase [Myxococcota bacterium]|nr:protein kinase [Myxococcota bacterium]